MKLKTMLLAIFIPVFTVALLACSSTATTTTSSVSPSASAATTSPSPSAINKIKSLKVGMYAGSADPYYQLLHDTLQACANDDTDCKWTVDFRVGPQSPDAQLQAAMDFLSADYDALVFIQDSAEATSKCIDKAKAARVPYFGAYSSFATSSNAKNAAGSCCYDFVQTGKYAGEQAVKSGAKKLIVVESQINQGSTSDQTLGYLLAYQEAGKNLGGSTAQQIAEQKSKAKQDGKQEIKVVSWVSGGGTASSTQQAMAAAIKSLGPQGFDSVYVQSDAMMEGVIDAMKDANLDPSKYFLSACGGTEKSLDWIKDGTIKCDVNLSAALEGDVLYQQIKAYFTGEKYRKYIHPYLTEFDASNIDQVTGMLIPSTDGKTYIAARKANKFAHNISDSKFTDIEKMGVASASASASAKPSATASKPGASPSPAASKPAAASPSASKK